MATKQLTKKAPRKKIRALKTLLDVLPADAKKAIAHNRAELEKAVRNVRVEVERRAETIVREAERKILKQMHAATEEQVRRLEKRVARLERLAQA